MKLLDEEEEDKGGISEERIAQIVESRVQAALAQIKPQQANAGELEKAKLTIDEMWHFYGGDPLRLILLYPDGSSRDVVLGNDPLKGQHVQFVIPAGVWQAGHCIENGTYSLFGCTLAPGFTGDIFTGGTQAELLKLYPDRIKDILE